MDRVIRIDERALEEALRLTPQERIRQANAAFKLYHALHHPYAKPSMMGADNPDDLPKPGLEERLSS